MKYMIIRVRGELRDKLVKWIEMKHEERWLSLANVFWLGVV